MTPETLTRVFTDIALLNQLNETFDAMTDTPLTDAIVVLPSGYDNNVIYHQDLVRLCRDLERKLAIARAALERILHPHHSRQAATPPSWAIAAGALEETKP